MSSDIGLYAMNATKHYLSPEHVTILYYSLIHPYYYMVVWGRTYKTHVHKFEILQKKAIIITTKSVYNEHTSSAEEIIPVNNCFQFVILII
jgi:hypothetical protein